MEGQKYRLDRATLYIDFNAVTKIERIKENLRLTMSLPNQKTCGSYYVYIDPRTGEVDDEAFVRGVLPQPEVQRILASAYKWVAARKLSGGSHARTSVGRKSATRKSTRRTSATRKSATRKSTRRAH